MRSRTAARIGAIAFILVLSLALQSCAVSSAPASKKPSLPTELSPLFPTAVVAPSPLPTPTPAVKPASDFSLPRENGQTVHLSDFRDKSSVVLVFYRGQT